MENERKFTYEDMKYALNATMTRISLMIWEESSKYSKDGNIYNETFKELKHIIDMIDANSPKMLTNEGIDRLLSFRAKQPKKINDKDEFEKWLIERKRSNNYGE